MRTSRTSSPRRTTPPPSPVLARCCSNRRSYLCTVKPHSRHLHHRPCLRPCYESILPVCLLIYHSVKSYDDACMHASQDLNAAAAFFLFPSDAGSMMLRHILSQLAARCAGHGSDHPSRVNYRSSTQSSGQWPSLGVSPFHSEHERCLRSLDLVQVSVLSRR